MLFGRRGDDRIRIAITEAIGAFEARAESRMTAEALRRHQLDLAIVEAVRALRAEFGTRDHELARAIESVARAVEHTAVRIESDSAERQALVDAVLALMQPVPDWRVGRSRERVIGGVIGGSVNETTNETTNETIGPPEGIDLTQPPP